MPMFRIQPSERRVQLFRSTALREHYFEEHLEDWVQANPQILTDGVPLLIIGRQVPTTGGILDLLALDNDGTLVVIELKRGATPRDIVAQALEYTAWAASQSPEQLLTLAESYLSTLTSPVSLTEAWHQAFGGDAGMTGVGALADNARLNERQRTLLVIEGESERIAAVIRYLRTQGMDITLTGYTYYRTASGEEMLDIEQLVGETEAATDAVAAPARRHVEDEVVASWPAVVQETYHALRRRLVEGGLTLRVSKTAVSFYAQTRDGRVFVGFATPQANVLGFWMRADVLQPRLDFRVATEAIARVVEPEGKIKSAPMWYLVTLPAKPASGAALAEVLLSEVVTKLE